jgi:hypothetical protein
MDRQDDHTRMETADVRESISDGMYYLRVGSIRFAGTNTTIEMTAHERL